MAAVPPLTKSKADPSLRPCSLATTPDLHPPQSQSIIIVHVILYCHHAFGLVMLHLELRHE